MRDAKVRWNAFDFRSGVRYQSYRARTHGHVILCQADGVLAATVLNANGFASVRGAIA